MYLTYDKYQDRGGTLSEADFDFLAYEAESYINWYTFDRLKKFTTIPQEVVDCEFYLVRLLQTKLGALGVGSLETGDAGTAGISQTIASQSNDGVSVSFNTLSAHDAISDISGEMGSAINRYLQGIKDNLGRKILYRGLYPDE